jgi:hypothetical protein
MYLLQLTDALRHFPHPGGGIAPAHPTCQRSSEPDVQVLYSLQAEARHGFMASAIGDLNGDGASEFIIGAC